MPKNAFQFDLQGFMVVKDVLGGVSSCACMNAAVDGKFDEYAKPSEHWRPHRLQPLEAAVPRPDRPRRADAVGARRWSGPYFRIDHDYCIFMSRG